MDTQDNKQEVQELEELIEAQARGEDPGELALPAEQDAPQEAELDSRISKLTIKFQP